MFLVKHSHSNDTKHIAFLHFLLVIFLICVVWLDAFTYKQILPITSPVTKTT